MGEKTVEASNRRWERPVSVDKRVRKSTVMISLHNVVTSIQLIYRRQTCK